MTTIVIEELNTWNWQNKEGQNLEAEPSLICSSCCQTQGFQTQPFRAINYSRRIKTIYFLAIKEQLHSKGHHGVGLKKRISL